MKASRRTRAYLASEGGSEQEIIKNTQHIREIIPKGINAVKTLRLKTLRWSEELPHEIWPLVARRLAPIHRIRLYAASRHLASLKEEAHVP